MEGFKKEGVRDANFLWFAFSYKVNSVQEACAILEFEILQITRKKLNKETLSFQFFTNRSSILMFFVLFFSCGLQDVKF